MAQTKPAQRSDEVIGTNQAGAATTAAFDKAAAQAEAQASAEADKKRIADLEAQIAQLAAEKAQLVDQTEVPAIPGNVVRAERGPIHSQTKEPIFNVNRPTGKHG